MIIYLGRMLPYGSSSLPEASARRHKNEQLHSPKGSPLLDLAPDGGYPAAALLQSLVVSYTTISPLPGKPGGLFLWPVPIGSLTLPIPGVARHLALWSADFPQRSQGTLRSSDQPGKSIIPCVSAAVNIRRVGGKNICMLFRANKFARMYN